MKVQKNWLEWSVFAVSLAITLAVLAVLVVSEIRSREEPADIRVYVGAPVRGASGHRLPVVVRNEGDQTAEQVHVEVVLRRGESEEERGSLTIAFVPRRSERRGWVSFRSDPRCCAVDARAVGYEEP